MATVLTDEQVGTALTGLTGWSGTSAEISRSVKAPSFLDGIRLVDAVAQAAEAADHHPDIDIRWRTVTFRLSTHSAGGVTDKDIALARRIDELAAELTGAGGPILIRVLVVLVNGLPGAGKTTLARVLAPALGLPLFSKDDIKETLADVLGARPPDARTPLDWSRALGAASIEVIWTLLGGVSAGAVVETPLLPGVRHHVTAGLARAGIAVHAVREVWCEVPTEVAMARYTARMPDRHAVHTGDPRGFVLLAAPLALGTVFRVDTTVPVDIPALAAALRADDPRLSPHS